MARLLEKLETAREALGGRVYDVLGELFEGTALKDLLFQAIQYGEQEEVRRVFSGRSMARSIRRICWNCFAAARSPTTPCPRRRSRSCGSRWSGPKPAPSAASRPELLRRGIPASGRPSSSAGRKGAGKSPMCRCASGSAIVRSAPARRSRSNMSGSASRRAGSISSRSRLSSVPAIRCWRQ